MQAVALDGSLATVGNSAQLARTFYKRAAKVIDIPWQIAAGSDLAYPEAEGPRPLATPLLNRYMKRALLAAQVSPDVNTALLLVQNLMAAPSTLMRPAMVRKVLRGSAGSRSAPANPLRCPPACARGGVLVRLLGQLTLANGWTNAVARNVPKKKRPATRKRSFLLRVK